MLENLGGGAHAFPVPTPMHPAFSLQFDYTEFQPELLYITMSSNVNNTISVYSLYTSKSKQHNKCVQFVH